MNGEYTKPFDAARDLRQGDPMSPFFFAIAMEYLSRCLKGLLHNRRFKFHPKCAKMEITHLSFADDLLIFARGDANFVNALNECFNQLSLVSGLKANLDKSCVFFGGVQQRERDMIIIHQVNRFCYWGATI